MIVAKRWLSEAKLSDVRKCADTAAPKKQAGVPWPIEKSCTLQRHYIGDLLFRCSATPCPCGMQVPPGILQRGNKQHGRIPFSGWWRDNASLAARLLFGQLEWVRSNGGEIRPHQVTPVIDAAATGIHIQNNGVWQVFAVGAGYAFPIGMGGVAPPLFPILPNSVCNSL